MESTRHGEPRFALRRLYGANAYYYWDSRPGHARRLQTRQLERSAVQDRQVRIRAHVVERSNKRQSVLFGPGLIKLRPFLLPLFTNDLEEGFSEVHMQDLA